MHEYGVSWMEIEREWTFSQACFFATRIRERYEQSASASKRRKGATVNESDLGTEWMSG